jgi:hypothetical protein
MDIRPHVNYHPMRQYLEVTETIDWQHPEIKKLAQQLRRSDHFTRTIFPEPLSQVIQALQTYNTWGDLLRHLPDLKHEDFSQLTAT